MSTRKRPQQRRRPPTGRKPAARKKATARKKPAERRKAASRKKTTAPKKQPRRLGIVPQLVALILVLGLTAAMAIQPTRQLFAQRDRISEMSGSLKTVNKSNKALNDRIDRLNDPDYLEQIARDSGYARPGETVYNVVPPSRKELKREEKRRAHKSRPAPEPDPGFMERFLNFVGLG